MKNSKLLVFVFVGVVFATVSCSKSTTGPAGPAGARGPAGPDSVYHSAWTAINMTLLGVDTTGGANDSVWNQAITSQTITQNVLDSDLILTYFETTNGSNGSETVIEAADLSFQVDIEYSVGGINITSYGFDFPLNGITAVRFVIVPGSILTTNSVLKGLTKAQIKAADYSVIMGALGISGKTTPN